MNKVTVTAVRLDSILKSESLNVSRRTLIKIDVEGTATSVLKGVTETLKQKPKFVVELHPTEENIENGMRKYGNIYHRE
jgi:FkbM family methyltransferase